MSNYSFARASGLGSRKLFSAYCAQLPAIQARFAGQLRVTQDDQGISLTLADKSAPQFALKTTLWREPRRGLSWATEIAPTAFWFSETVASIGLASVETATGKAIILSNEGIDETFRPEFHRRYPTLSDWMLSETQFGSAYIATQKLLLKKLKKIHPEIMPIIERRPELLHEEAD